MHRKPGEREGGTDDRFGDLAPFEREDGLVEFFAGGKPDRMDLLKGVHSMIVCNN